MDQYLAKDFGKLLKRNALSVRRQMLPRDTDVMRVYDRNLDQLPITIDLYGNWARITDYGDVKLTKEDKEVILDTVSRMLYVEQDKVIYHRREKRSLKEQHDIIDTESLFITVRENNLKFKVDLTKRIDTGLFLDQILAREAVRRISSNMRVLNLFSYTGAFSIYAASGGAQKVTSVDLSATYCSWCEENLEANLFAGDNYPVINTDALQFIEQEIQKNQKYDLIIFDPPTFSNSNKSKNDFDVQKDYLKFIHLLNTLLAKEGILLFSVNKKNFNFNKREIDGYEITEITKDILAPGFSAKRNSLRSWILTKTGESRRMSEQQEKGSEKRKSKPREYNKREDDFVLSYEDNNPSSRRNYQSSNQRDERRRDQRPYKGKRDFKGREDRPRNRDERSSRDRREFSSRDDRPRRDFQSRDERGSRDRREFTSRDDRPRRDFQSRDERGSRDRREFSSRDNRPRRDFQSRDERGSRNRREFSSRDDRPRRDYQGRDERGYRDRREFSNRDDRPRRDFQSRDERGSRDRREFSNRDDRPRRDFQGRDERGSRDRREFSSRDNRPRRDFQSRDERGSRDRREFSNRDNRPRRDFRDRQDNFQRERSFDNQAGLKEGEQRKSSGPRPYGYDRFKPTSNRGSNEERLRRDSDEKES